MASNTITHSGYAIYYEEHKAYLDHAGKHYDMICEECIWREGFFTSEALAEAVGYCRKVFKGNIYVVKVEIKAEKVNRHGKLGFVPNYSYEKLSELWATKTQHQLEDAIHKTKDKLKRLEVLKANKVLTEKGYDTEVRVTKTFLLWARKYVNERFNGKKEVNDGRE